jgi:hypothetical protein
MFKLNLTKGVHKSYKLSFSRLVDVNAAKAKIIVSYWNRAELLNQFLNKNVDRVMTGAQILNKIQRIENEIPIILGGEPDADFT